MASRFASNGERHQEIGERGLGRQTWITCHFVPVSPAAKNKSDTTATCWKLARAQNSKVSLSPVSPACEIASTEATAAERRPIGHEPVPLNEHVAAPVGQPPPCRRQAWGQAPFPAARLTLLPHSRATIKDGHIEPRKFSSGLSAHTKRAWMALLSLCLIAGSEPKPVTRIYS